MFLKLFICWACVVGSRVWGFGSAFCFAFVFAAYCAVRGPQLPVALVQSPSPVRLCNPRDCRTPGRPVPHHFPGFVQVHELVMPPGHLTLCCPPLLMPSVIPSIGVLSSESAVCIGWTQYWSSLTGDEAHVPCCGSM